jgi:hypothetical protein
MKLPLWSTRSSNLVAIMYLVIIFKKLNSQLTDVSIIQLLLYTRFEKT